MSEILRLNGALSAGVRTGKGANGHDHMIVPAVVLKEGVLNNILYPKDKIVEFSEKWNGVAVTVNHPEKDGKPISAKDDGCDKIGFFQNVRAEQGDLKGELWIDIEKANTLGFSKIISDFESGKMMEVSTGLYCNTKDDPGSFGEKAYERIIETMTPDHIAILPNEEGACSIKDGCGAMRHNKDQIEKAKKLGQKGKIFTVNEISHSELWQKLNDELEKVMKDDPEAYPYIVDIFDGRVIYQIDDRLYRRDFEVRGDFIELDDEPQEVVKKIKYKLKRRIDNKEQNEVETVNNQLSSDDLALFQTLKNRETMRVNSLRDTVKANYPTLKPDVVDNFDTEALEGLAASVKPAADFSGRGGANLKTNKEERTHTPVLFATLEDTKNGKN